MSSPNPFRGTNVCHRLELPVSRRPRRTIRRGRGLGVPGEGARSPRSGSVEPIQADPMAPVLTAQPANDREIALLQRRLAKLSALLETQEGQLKQVVGKLAGDPGLASIYRTVQGVEASDPESDRKRELMSRLFEANIDLRRRLDS